MSMYNIRGIIKDPHFFFKSPSKIIFYMFPLTENVSVPLRMAVQFWHNTKVGVPYNTYLHSVLSIAYVLSYTNRTEHVLCV